MWEEQSLATDASGGGGKRDASQGQQAAGSKRKVAVRKPSKTSSIYFLFLNVYDVDYQKLPETGARQRRERRRAREG